MLRLSQQIYDAIRQHGEKAYPHECCGVLLGRFTGSSELAVNEVEEAAPAGNAATDAPHHRYAIAPEELIRLQREGRGKGLEIVGFYHSHPDHPAHWSPTDLDEAHWLGCSYVITAVERGAARQTNSFLLAGASEEDKRFEEQRIEITGQMDPGLEPSPTGEETGA